MFAFAVNNSLKNVLKSGKWHGFLCDICEGDNPVGVGNSDASCRFYLLYNEQIREDPNIVTENRAFFAGRRSRNDPALEDLPPHFFGNQFSSPQSMLSGVLSRRCCG